MTEISRRYFLRLAAHALLATSGLLGLGMLLRFLGHQSEAPAPTEFDLGPASGIPIGSRILLAEIPALLVRTEAGFSAISLACTHLGCTVEPGPDGFTCACHGSRFGLDGSVLRGPAERSLVRLRVEQSDQGHVIILRED